MHVGRRASDLLDGRLNPVQEQTLRLHLGRCPRCAELVRSEAQVRRALRACCTSEEPTPQDLVTGLMQLPVARPGTAPVPAPVRQPGRRTKLGLLAAGAVVATLAVAAPVVFTGGAAVAALIPQPWQSGDPGLQVVVVPAGPRAGAVTSLRVNTPPDQHP